MEGKWDAGRDGGEEGGACCMNNFPKKVCGVFGARIETPNFGGRTAQERWEKWEGDEGVGGFIDCYLLAAA